MRKVLSRKHHEGSREALRHGSHWAEEEAFLEEVAPGLPGGQLGLNPSPRVAHFLQSQSGFACLPTSQGSALACPSGMRGLALSFHTSEDPCASRLHGENGLESVARPPDSPICLLGKPAPRCLSCVCAHVHTSTRARVSGDGSELVRIGVSTWMRTCVCVFWACASDSAPWCVRRYQGNLRPVLFPVLFLPSESTGLSQATPTHQPPCRALGMWRCSRLRRGH